MDREMPAKVKTILVDKTELAIPQHPRIKDPDFRAWINTLECTICGAKAPLECAHVRFGMGGGLNRKPDDPGRVVPLCVNCHRLGQNAQHGKRGEQVWWQRAGIDPLLLGTWLWEIYTADRKNKVGALAAIAQCRPKGRD
jgi:hypothetical protein